MSNFFNGISALPMAPIMLAELSAYTGPDINLAVAGFGQLLIVTCIDCLIYSDAPGNLFQIDTIGGGGPTFFFGITDGFLDQYFSWRGWQVFAEADGLFLHQATASGVDVTASGFLMPSPSF